MSTTRNVTLNQPSSTIDDVVRQTLIAAVNSAFETTLADNNEVGESWDLPPVARADQLKAWLADHWLSLEEDFVLLMPGKDIEPGVLNVNINGSDVFVGIASLESFQQAAEKLAEIPPAITAMLQSSKAYSLPVWLCLA